MSRKTVLRLLICASIGAFLGFAATFSGRISGVTAPLALAVGSLVLLICAINLLLKVMLKDRGSRAVLTYSVRLGSRWTPLAPDETLTAWQELAELHPSGVAVRGWQAPSGMIWLECTADDTEPFTVICQLPSDPIRSGWIAGPMFWLTRGDQPQHRSGLPFQMFQRLDHPWNRVSEDDIGWNWSGEARGRGATGDVIAFHCATCGGIRFDCLKEGRPTHLVARGAGDEGVVRRAFGLFVVYYGPALYPVPIPASQ